MTADRLSASDLLGMSRRQLAGIMADGHPIDPRALEGTEYKGVSLGLPGFVDKLLWKTFRKTFLWDNDTKLLRGWNVRMRQTGLDGPREPMTRNGEPITFGHYVVTPAGDRKMLRPWNRGLFLDYGPAAFNTPFDLGRIMRAPVVAVNPGDAELLLGWDYVQLGSLQLPTPAYWTLEYEGPISHVVAPPRRPTALLPAGAPPQTPAGN